MCEFASFRVSSGEIVVAVRWPDALGRGSERARWKKGREIEAREPERVGRELKESLASPVRRLNDTRPT